MHKLEHMEQPWRVGILEGVGAAIWVAFGLAHLPSQALMGSLLHESKADRRE